MSRVQSSICRNIYPMPAIWIEANVKGDVDVLREASRVLPIS